MALRMMATLVMAALIAVGSAQAGTAREVRKQAESSLRVSGSIVIGMDGAVLSHELDPEAPLTPVLVEFIRGAVAKWRFEPVLVDGKRVNAKVPMSLRLVARRADDGNVSVSIASTYFGAQSDAPATDQPQSVQMTPPRYPKGALYMGGKGTVYLIVQVGRDGKVLNADAEQVNLRVAGTTAQMNELRKQFTDASVRAARGWKFSAPTTGEEANQDSWLVRVPVDYVLVGPGERRLKPDVGWDTYIPGPRNAGMPWAAEKLRMAGSPDALPEEGVFPLRQGAKLLSPPAT